MKGGNMYEKWYHLYSNRLVKYGCDYFKYVLLR